MFYSFFFAGSIGPANFAQAVVVQLGDQDFTNGQGVGGVAQFDSASMGEPFPFNRSWGSLARHRFPKVGRSISRPASTQVLL
jgi:hypothetical protein